MFQLYLKNKRDQKMQDHNTVSSDNIVEYLIEMFNTKGQAEYRGRCEPICPYVAMCGGG